MTTLATDKEEDLIILSDDTSSNDTSIMDFDFGQVQASTETTTDLSPVQTTDEFVLDFGDTKTEEVTTDFSLEDNNLKLSETKEEVSFGQDLFWDSTESTEATLEVASQSSTWMDFSFDGEVSAKSQDAEIWALTTSVEETSFDRNAILDEAIAKMQTRKSSISSSKSSKQSKVDELNEQIASLKSQVSDLEWEIKDLEKEDSALDLDISSIEKMKTSVLEISTDRPRKHNLNNIKK